MNKPLLYIATLLALFSCSRHPREARIQGTFAHLEQGEFYLYSSDGALPRVDTLHIVGGRFDYTLPLEGKATLHILYPNFSQLTLFAEGGDDIEVEGDAQNLNAVEVSGSDDNELYTSFRKETEGKSSAETRATAKKYALENPTLAVSRYLFSQYFLLNDSLPQEEVTEIYDSLCHASPQDAALLKMAGAVRAYASLNVGRKLPEFKLHTRPSVNDEKDKGRVISNRDFRGNYLLISFWASWKGGSQSALFRTRKTVRIFKDKGLTLNALSYSLDTSDNVLRDLERRDSIYYHSYCDFRCFESELARKWHIRELPYYILVGPDMKIVASGSDWQEDIDPKVKKICL